MDCVILAGGQIAENDPLFQYTDGEPKALIDLGGRTLLEWVIDAMRDSSSIDEIAVVGVERPISLGIDYPIHFLPDNGSLISNGFAGITWARERNSEETPILFCTADIPAITGVLVDEHISACRPFDRAAYYSFVTRRTMDKRFPGAKRTYTRLDGEDVASCDLVILRPEIVKTDRRLLDALENARKHPWKVARIVGARILARLMLGQLSISEVESTAERILGKSVQVMISERAELAMDIDKPSHLELLRAEFEQPTGSA
jgi:GTP:adenosylcobinamide-phosphate guanylyltransferase